MRIRPLVVLIEIGLLVGVVVFMPYLPSPPAPAPPAPPVDIYAECRLDTSPLHTCADRIMNSLGQPVQITGVSWFGMETGTYAPHGLWTRNWQAMLDQIAALGFNTIRLPFSDDALSPGRMPQSINYERNPDLAGKTSIEIMDKLIQGAANRGLKVILDRHRPTAQAQSELWYTDTVSEQQWIQEWVALARRYVGQSTVIGVDLHNEPRGPATWGSADPTTDWRLAAERAGDAILDVNPDLLIFVQGVERQADDWYWWGGNLQGVRADPVRLSVPGRVVYSPHDYGPGVYGQPWFDATDFPANLPTVWDSHWGFIAREHIAPVVLGEFGGRSVGADTEGVWQRALMDYLARNEIGWLNWSFNPDSSDTGGLLGDDWLTVIEEKAQLYRAYLAPPLDVGTSGAFGQARGQLVMRVRASSPASQTNNLGFTVQVVNDQATSIDLRDLEVRYWFRPGALANRTQQVDIDYAAVGAANVRTEIGPANPAGLAALKLRFADTAGTVAAYSSSGDIIVRVHKSDWSNYGAQPDASLALYQRGRLVWGAEPTEPVAEGAR